jgi:hypothetical protein
MNERCEMDHMPRPPLPAADVIALQERALAAFDSFEWKRVPERGTWEACFEGEVLQCPASTDPRLDRPHPEEMIVATVCYHCGGYFPVDDTRCPNCGFEAA